MGYTTRFTGAFKVEPPLSVPHYNELFALVRDGVEDENAPNAYLQWEPTPNGDGIQWDGGEKFYHYDEWLQWLIDCRLAVWGHTVSGSVRWVGEHASDVGVLVVEGNKVSAHKADAKTIQVLVPLALIQRHAEHDDAAMAIAAHVVDSAKKQGAV